MGLAFQQFLQQWLSGVSTPTFFLDVDRCCVHYNATGALWIFEHSSERIVREISPPFDKKSERFTFVVCSCIVSLYIHMSDDLQFHFNCL